MEVQPPDVTVWMIHRDLARVPAWPFPAGYHMRPYTAGDLKTWLQVQADDPFFVPTAEIFAAALPGDDAYLAERVMFMVDPAGAAIGTITAWNTASLTGDEIGQIHWVAIVAAARGRGLAKPMLSAVCERLRAFGHRAACLETNTRRVPALNLYRQAGFEPFPRDEAEEQAWRAVAPLLKGGLGLP